MNSNSNYSNSNYFSMKPKSSFRCRSSSGDKRKQLNCPLKSDKCRDTQNSLIEMALADLRRVRFINFRICEPSTDQNSLILQRFLQSFRNSALDEAKSSSFKMIEDIKLLQKTVDDKLMDDVLDYFSILRREMNSNLKKLSLNSADCGRRKRQAKRLRNVIIFSRNIQIETQGAVTLTSIEPDSSQWARCQKAVAENLNISGMER